MEVSRDRVLRELQDATALARRNGDPGAMIAAWRELGKICRYYAPERTVKVDVNIAAKRVVDRLETLSDRELMELTAQLSHSGDRKFRTITLATGLQLVTRAG